MPRTLALPLTADQCAPVLRALGEPLRLRIVSLLRDGPLAVCDITARLGVRQYQASRHLAALLDLGVVSRARRGRRVVYALAQPVADGATPTVELGCCRVSVE
jgi:DNA-binding transcriptional ArsR family regulator